MISADSNGLRVMLAGIGGASLGTEILKCLKLAGGYRTFGCDISSTAYGLYDPEFAKTYLVERGSYVTDVLRACIDADVAAIIPGGEEPTRLLGAEAERFSAHGIRVITNVPDVVSRFADKGKAFALLEAEGFPIPRTTRVDANSDIDRIGLPCIIKPATESGGSVSVYFAVSQSEAWEYAQMIRRIGGIPIAQEYIDESEGEFTVGVLSRPDGSIAGSVALRRTLDAKLSVSSRGRGGVVSSGYSQGFIGKFPSICSQAERIAVAIGSCGPINIQGRVKAGVLYPFEINPRFSASTYLRAMAGFNEVDCFLRMAVKGERPELGAIREGWYLRSLTEHFVPVGALLS